MLISCKECKNKVSENAAACPKCGNPITPEQITEAKKEAKTQGWVNLVSAAIVGILVAYFFFTSNSETERRDKTGPLSKIPERVKKQFHYYDGSHIRLEKYIIENMNDPDSYEHIQTTYTYPGIGSKTMRVYTVYSGRNAFGGTVKNWVLAEVDTKTGQVKRIVETGP